METYVGANGIGKKLRTLRISRGLSLRQVENGTKVDASQLSKIERGVCDATLHVLEVLVGFYGTPIAELFRPAPRTISAVPRQHKNGSSVASG